MTLRSFFLILVASAFLLACQPDAPGSGSISAEQFLSSPPRDALVLDVRTQAEFADGHIASAVNIPHDELASRLEEIGGHTDLPIVVYCERGGRAANATEVLEQAGYSRVIHLEGDMSGWRAEGRPVVRN